MTDQMFLQCRLLLIWKWSSFNFSFAFRNLEMLHLKPPLFSILTLKEHRPTFWIIPDFVLTKSLLNISGNCFPTMKNFYTIYSVCSFSFQPLRRRARRWARWWDVKLSVHQQLSRWRSAFKQRCSVGEQSKVRIWLTLCRFIQSRSGIWTSFSAFLFDWAYRGLDVTCLKSYYSYYKFLSLSAVEARSIVIHYCVWCAVTRIDLFNMCYTSIKDGFDSNTFQKHLE